MLYDLLGAWKSGSLPGLLAARPPLPDEQNRTPDDVVLQSNFEFDIPPRVVFVGEFERYTIANKYRDLPSPSLTTAEEKKLAQARVKFSKEKGFYNGNHLLLTGVRYDDEVNVVYLRSLRIDFAFMRALELKIFPINSELYKQEFFKTGVLVPFITSDDYTFFLRRADKFGLISAVAGFLECQYKSMSLQNLIERTAINEACEEVLNDVNNNPRVAFSLPIIKSISIRVSEGHIPAIEFIAPMHVNCSRRSLNHILITNRAKDAKEHKAEHYPVPLGSAERSQALSFLANKFSGKFLFSPMLVSASILANKAARGNFIPRNLPHTRTEVISIAALLALSKLPKRICFAASSASKLPTICESKADFSRNRFKKRLSISFY